MHLGLAALSSILAVQLYTRAYSRVSPVSERLALVDSATAPVLAQQSSRLSDLDARIGMLEAVHGQKLEALAAQQAIIVCVLERAGHRLLGGAAAAGAAVEQAAEVAADRVAVEVMEEAPAVEEAAAAGAAEGAATGSA